MLPDRVSNPGPLTYESGALPIALRGPAIKHGDTTSKIKHGDTTSKSICHYAVMYLLDIVPIFIVKHYLVGCSLVMLSHILTSFSALLGRSPQGHGCLRH